MVNAQPLILVAYLALFHIILSKLIEQKFTGYLLFKAQHQKILSTWHLLKRTILYLPTFTKVFN